MPTDFPATPDAGLRRDAVTGNALASLSMLVWALSFPAAELLLESWDPIVLISVRFVLVVVLLVLLWAAIEGTGPILRARWLKGILIGGPGFGLAAYLLLLGQWMTDPVTVAIIVSFSPVAGVLLEVIADRRRLRTQFALGVVICVAGGVVATGASEASGAEANLGYGAGAAAISVFLFAWASRAAVSSFPELSATGRATVTMAGGLIGVAPVCLIALAAGIAAPPSGPVGVREIGLLILYAPMGMALSQVLWIAGVGRLGIAVASFHINLSPFYVMLFMLALGAEWNRAQALGATLVVAGVIVAQWRRRHRAVRAVPPRE